MLLSHQQVENHHQPVFGCFLDLPVRMIEYSSAYTCTFLLVNWFIHSFTLCKYANWVLCAQSLLKTVFVQRRNFTLLFCLLCDSSSWNNGWLAAGAATIEPLVLLLTGLLDKPASFLGRGQAAVSCILSILYLLVQYSEVTRCSHLMWLHESFLQLLVVSTTDWPTRPCIHRNLLDSACFFFWFFLHLTWIDHGAKMTS